MPDWLIARPVAHRGLHNAAAGVIENTLSAFRAAIDGNYAIECDLQISADGEAMVHHDEALGRLTEGAGRLAAMTASELKRVRFLATPDRMLTLGELCDLVAGRVTLLLELKSHYDGDERLAKRVAGVLAGYAGPVAAMSFDPAHIALLRRFAPTLRRGLVAQRFGHRGEHDAPGLASRLAAQLVAVRPQFLAYCVQDLPAFAPLFGRYILALPLLTWTVRTAQERAHAARWADQIIFEGFRP